VKNPNIVHVWWFPCAHSLPPDFGSKKGLIIKIHDLSISNIAIAIIIRVYGERFCDWTRKRKTRQEPRIDIIDDIVVNIINMKTCSSERVAIRNGDIWLKLESDYDIKSPKTSRWRVVSMGSNSDDLAKCHKN
jgi:hypothetical protein